MSDCLYFVHTHAHTHTHTHTYTSTHIHIHTHTHIHVQMSGSGGVVTEVSNALKGNHYIKFANHCVHQRSRILTGSTE